MKTPAILKLAAQTARLLPDSLKRRLYQFGPVSSTLRNALNRAAPAGRTEVEIAAGGLQGMHMHLDLQSEKDYWLGTYELELQAAVQDWVQPGMLIYDVGANIGYVSLLLARATGPEGRVVSFEALPENIERLRANIELNGLQVQIQVEHAAVVDAESGPGPITFLVHASSGMGKAAGSAGRQEAYGLEIQVPATSLDAYVYAQRNSAPDLIKIDIEGGEVLALPGMRRLLLEKQPLIFLELHGREAAESAWKLFSDCGYWLARMQPGYPKIEQLDQLDWKAYVISGPSGRATG